MNRENARTELSAQILEEASAWFIEFNEGELEREQRVQFNQWIRRSPEHIRAYLEIAATWEDASGLSNEASQDVQALLAAAMSESNVVPISSASGVAVEPKQTPQEKPAGVLRRRFAIAVGLVAVAIGVTAWTALIRNTYTTDIGEQRSITLADGSMVKLNSHSKLRIDFSENERTVSLLQGQALFQVSKDAQRPFIVVSGTTRVRAVGTQFDVYRKTSGTTVTVLEGKVSVGSAQSPSVAFPKPATHSDSAAIKNDASPDPVLLTAGEQVIVTAMADIPVKPKAIDVAVATAWTQHKLIFEDTPLTEAAEEFNRYNTKRIVIDDPSLKAFRVRGTFSANDPARLADFLKQRFGVTVSDTRSETRISRAGA